MLFQQGGTVAAQPVTLFGVTLVGHVRVKSGEDGQGSDLSSSNCDDDLLINYKIIN